jgi:hypothetical protein
MNRYIKAMEIGIDNENKGISYFDLVYELHGTKNQVYTLEAEQTFCEWFIKNFSCLDDYDDGLKMVPIDFRSFLIDNSKCNDYHQRGANSFLYDHLDQKWFLNGNAAKQYLDYKEYKAARRNSLVATIFATISILIAAVTFWYSYQSDLNSPQPPYDVKIIEDTQLRKENDKLRDDLYKAQMMVKVLEDGDSII